MPTRVPAHAQLLSRIQLFKTLGTAAYQTPLSMGFPRQGYWNGLPFPPPGDLPDPGIEPKSPALLGGSLPSEPPGHLPDPGMEPASPALLGGSLPPEPPGKPGD